VSRRTGSGCVRKIAFECAAAGDAGDRVARALSARVRPKASPAAAETWMRRQALVRRRLDGMAKASADRSVRQLPLSPR
jgi:hypothetical protein